MNTKKITMIFIGLFFLTTIIPSSTSSLPGTLEQMAPYGLFAKALISATDASSIQQIYINVNDLPETASIDPGNSEGMRQSRQYVLKAEGVSLDGTPVVSEVINSYFRGEKTNNHTFEQDIVDGIYMLLYFVDSAQKYVLPLAMTSNVDYEVYVALYDSAFNLICYEKVSEAGGKIFQRQTNFPVYSMGLNISTGKPAIGQKAGFGYVITGQSGWAIGSENVVDNLIKNAPTLQKRLEEKAQQESQQKTIAHHANRQNRQQLLSVVSLAQKEVIQKIEVGLSFSYQGSSYYSVIDLASLDPKATKTTSYLAQLQNVLKSNKVIFKAEVVKGGSNYSLVVSAQKQGSSDTIFSKTLTNFKVLREFGDYSAPMTNSATLQQITLGYQTNNMVDIKMYSLGTQTGLQDSMQVTFDTKKDLSIFGTIKNNGSGSGSGNNRRGGGDGLYG